MQILNIQQAHAMAGIYHTDTELEQDIKFEQYFSKYRIRVADSVTSQVLLEAKQENLDFLITKE